MAAFDKPRHVIYLSRRYSDDPDGNQVAVDIFDMKWQAHLALHVLLEDDGLVWSGDNYLRSETGIIAEVRPSRQTTATLRELWDYDMPVKRLGNELDAHRIKALRRFRYVPDPTVAPEKKVKTRSLTRTSRNGMVPIADIALEFGLEACEVRAAFRRAKIPKPPQGWAFPASEVEAIKQKVKEVLGL